jgi:hypothetical protein
VRACAYMHPVTPATEEFWLPAAHALLPSRLHRGTDRCGHLRDLQPGPTCGGAQNACTASTWALSRRARAARAPSPKGGLPWVRGCVVLTQAGLPAARLRAQVNDATRSLRAFSGGSGCSSHAHQRPLARALSRLAQWCTAAHTVLQQSLDLNQLQWEPSAWAQR